jgi:hypothetical protein
MRSELPPDLDERDRAAVNAALEEYLRAETVRPSPWALAGRTEGLGLGALQVRFQSTEPWGETRLNPYTRRGADPRIGRGDSR